jgi:Trp operon repressor
MNTTKKTIFILLLIFIQSLTLHAHKEQPIMTSSNESVGQQYINFLKKFITSEDTSPILNSLISPDVKKIVLSKTLCKNREELLEQMLNVKNSYNPHNINLLESLQAGNKHVIRWEISFKTDRSHEAVISILTCNDRDQIEEINEVFGDIGEYEEVAWKK